MSIVGKLIEVAIDASILSAGVSFARRGTGYRVPTKMIASPVVRKYTEKYLEFGEGLAEKFVEGSSALGKAYKTHPLGDACKIAALELGNKGWSVPSDGVRYLAEEVKKDEGKATPAAAEKKPAAAEKSAAKKSA